MTDQPTRITPAELSDLLDRLCPVSRSAPAARRLDYLDWKAGLLSKLAADLGTPEAYLVSAAAWEQARDLLCDNSQWEAQP